MRIETSRKQNLIFDTKKSGPSPTAEPRADTRAGMGSMLFYIASILLTASQIDHVESSISILTHKPS